MIIFITTKTIVIALGVMVALLGGVCYLHRFIKNSRPNDTTDLSEFTEQTITAIYKGIATANKHKMNNAPFEVIAWVPGGQVTSSNRNDIEAEFPNEISFDVRVTNSKTASGDLNMRVINFMNSNMSSTSENSSVNKIAFSIPFKRYKNPHAAVEIPKI